MLYLTVRREWRNNHANYTHTPKLPGRLLVVFRIFFQFTVCTDKRTKLCVAAPLAIVRPVERTPPLQTLRFHGFQKQAKIIAVVWQNGWDAANLVLASKLNVSKFIVPPKKHSTTWLCVLKHCCTCSWNCERHILVICETTLAGYIHICAYHYCMSIAYRWYILCVMDTYIWSQEHMSAAKWGKAFPLRGSCTPDGAHSVYWGLQMELYWGLQMERTVEFGTPRVIFGPWCSCCPYDSDHDGRTVGFAVV